MLSSQCFDHKVNTKNRMFSSFARSSDLAPKRNVVGNSGVRAPSSRVVWIQTLNDEFSSFDWLDDKPTRLLVQVLPACKATACSHHAALIRNRNFGSFWRVCRHCGFEFRFLNSDFWLGVFLTNNFFYLIFGFVAECLPNTDYRQAGALQVETDFL